MIPAPHRAPATFGAAVARELTGHAARDNAFWCDLFTRTHGLTGRTDRDAWSCPVRTPPGYPDAVTLRPGVDIAAVLGRIDTISPQCSVKDSYDDLDLSGHGFHELFRATWIAHHPGVVDRRGAAGEARTSGWRWTRVRTPDGLREWEAGWGHRSPEPFFRPELLGTDDVSVLAAWAGAELLAGAILTAGPEPVVGVSNVFTSGGEVGDAWAGIVAWTAVHHPGVPLVGYESGDDLAAALHAGFQALGPLRIWMADDAADDQVARSGHRDVADSGDAARS